MSSKGFNASQGAIGPVDIISVRKTADQAVSTQTTPQDATGLSFAIGANEVVRFRAWLPFNLAGVVSGAKFDVNGPASPTNVRVVTKAANMVAFALVAGAVSTAFATALTFALATAGDHFVEMEGTVENGANAGTVQIRFAQNVSDAGAITLRRGATLQIQRVP